MYSRQQIDAYFRRIGYSGGREVSLENLEAIHRQHLLSIPYENLDQMNGTPLDLSPEGLFDKMISRARGGYCFELQGLLCHLLQSLGYKVTQYAARMTDVPFPVQMRRHRVLVVDLDGERYVCDVGMRREFFRCPLLLRTGVVQTDGLHQYRYEKDPFFGWVIWQKLKGKDWQSVYGFTEEVQVDDDFVMPSFYCEMHPDSTFHRFMQISLCTEDSRLNIVENRFSRYSEGAVAERFDLASEDEAKECLVRRFGIDVPSLYRHFLKKNP